MGPKWRGRSVSTWVLLGLLSLLGMRGLVGGAQFIVEPTGSVIGVSTTVLDPVPVGDFLLPGLFVFCCLGVAPLVVVYGLYTGRAWGRGGAILVGMILAAWAIGEGLIIGWGERLQYLNLVQAIVMLLIAVPPVVRESAGIQWQQ